MDVNNYNNQNDYNYVCHVCGTVFDARQGVCPNCKTPANVVIPNAEALQTQNNKSGMKTAIIIVSVVLAVLVAVGSALAVVMMNKDEYSKNTAAGKTNSKKLTEAELINACDLIDYSVLAATFDKHTPSDYKEAMQTVIVDADNDGRQEMFVHTHNQEDFAAGIYNLGVYAYGVFQFEDINSLNSSMIQSSERWNEEYRFYFDESGTVYLISSSFAKGAYDNIVEKYTENGWETVGKFSGYHYDTDNGSVSEATLYGQIFTSLEDYENAIKAMNLTEISGNYSQYMSNYFYTSTPKDVIDAYTKRVSDLNIGAVHLVKDCDNDGENEYVFLLKDYAKLWTELAFEKNPYGDVFEYIGNLGSFGTALVYADTDDQGIVFHSMMLDYYNPNDNIEIKWDNGKLWITLNDGYSAPYVMQRFCDSAENARLSIENDENAGRVTIERYIEHISDPWRGGSNDPKPVVKMKYVDICDYPGKECILVVDDYSGSYVEVCTFYCGRAIVLYRINEHDGSVYLVNVDGKEHILYYSQARFDGIDGGGSTYCYKTIRFDQNCRPTYNDYQSITIYDNTPPTESHNAFFNGFNVLLATAKVCLDNYELTGYKYMQESDMNASVDVQSKYLAISNCNPTKSGLVNIQDVESWLNFREGPSTQYNKILLDPADSKSFVKQAKGSAVTVIDTVNTGDEKNPIWVKIQIKYADRTLVGYSSQNYIDIPNIRHISVGESFTVTANTNDSGLTWTCNDTGVLSIDSSSGAVTGVKRGLVLVTVRSDSGLYDSCLIMVD